MFFYSLFVSNFSDVSFFYILCLLLLIFLLLLLMMMMILHLLRALVSVPVYVAYIMNANACIYPVSLSHAHTH
jgi:hypothetical protein